mgnify:CR=1 FL=1
MKADPSKIPFSKATVRDGISVCVLNETLLAISSSLALIYNAGISNGVFPFAFKTTKVLPLHKTDSVQERSNYLLISVLPIFFKPLERHITSAHLLHLTSNNLLSLYSNKSRYHTNDLRGTALFNISDNCLKAMDNSELVGAV